MEAAGSDANAGYRSVSKRSIDYPHGAAGWHPARRSGALWLPRMSERNRRRWVAAVIALVGLIAAEFAMGFVANVVGAVGRGVIIAHAIPVLILLAYFIASWG